MGSGVPATLSTGNRAVCGLLQGNRNTTIIIKLG